MSTKIHLDAQVIIASVQRDYTENGIVNYPHANNGCGERLVVASQIEFVAEFLRKYFGQIPLRTSTRRRERPNASLFRAM